MDVTTDGGDDEREGSRREKDESNSDPNVEHEEHYNWENNGVQRGNNTVKKRQHAHQ